ncbi:MAG: EamA/RhaT family transporter, partial [Comamonadaceae bacterium]
MNDGIFYLITSVICSVSVAVVLKFARQYGVDIRQAIAANYLAAILLCWFLLNPSL